MMTIHNYGNVYVKFIDFVANHPGCTWAEINSHVHPGKPVYTSRTEFTGLVPRYIKIASKRGRAFTYELTSSGQDILEQAKRTKWVFDFINVVQKTQCTSLDEFDLIMTLFGDRKWVDPEFLRSISAACWNNGKSCCLVDDVDSWISLKIQSRIPFAKEIVEKMSDYGTDFMASCSPIENVTVEHMNGCCLVVNTAHREFALV